MKLSKIIPFCLIVIVTFASDLMGAQHLNVVVTMAELESVAKAIGADKIKITHLTDGRYDPHAVVTRPSMLIKMRRADLLILTGMDLDKWVLALIDASHNSSIRFGESGYLDVSYSIPNKLDVPKTKKIDMSMGDVHPQGNPHYMLDPENAKLAARTIANRLAVLMPEQKGYFMANLKLFNNKIDTKMVEWSGKMDALKNKKIITYHTSWAYFAKRFGLDIVGTLEPKPGIPPSTRHLQKVIRLIQQNGVDKILIASYFNDKPARFIAEKTGVKVLKAPVSVYGNKKVKDYFSLIDYAVEQLVKAEKE